MTKSITYDMIVVGAGISGLSLAYRIAKTGKSVLLVEAMDRIGGCLHTHYQHDHDFWVEMGAHTFYASYTNLIGLLQQSGMEPEIVARQKVGMKVFTDKVEKIFSRVSKWELLIAAPNFFFSKREGKTVKEYFGKIVGKKNYKKVFNRMFSAVIVQKADEFSAEFFLKRRNTKSKHHPKSFILKKGMQSFIQTLTKESNLEVLINQEVVAIEKEEGFRVKTKSGGVFHGKDIAFAASSAVNSKLLVSIHPQLSERLKEFPIQNIISRGFTIARKKIAIGPVSFIIPLQGPCFAMVTRDVMTDGDTRGFVFHFVDQQISKEEQEAFMANMLQIKLADLGTTVEARHSLPLLALGHKERIKDIKSMAEECGIYLTGNYFNGLSLEDCVERSNDEYERYLKNTK
ncbi:protoporphyrinogen/coproporphyrinogen oxidase [Ancylomarina longa]|uniref:FAD-dependent oxidoreductase n=1 Tax=Ancylomarina longa TaxID=2487017 RepID=A0A434AGC1_9BACT|nr:FAD-dependent oxidoreductase [Ancylomarina longa]RUT73449.1 FAD-dependent oxidoreductase [Ancylomarina longa]